ncbi:MAG: divergent PAP2 family protein [Spirochaetales bacterium]|jgi:acid phosphatase family membrane protein YuiD|nr:divergent PAP2 family protein [Spirochaetales bacterium]
MIDLFTNPIFLSTITASIAVQVLKVLIVLITDKALCLNRLLETGGMPSSHSAMVCALGTSTGITLGWASTEFIIIMAFGSIVIYDATGVRRAAGLHAKAINSLIKELEHILREGFKHDNLKTLLGHTFPQVFFGSLLGILIGYLFAINMG